MKKAFGFVVLGLGIVSLASCGKKEESSTTTQALTTTVTTTAPEVVEYSEFSGVARKGTTSGEYNLCDSVQDGAILHAWNWSYNTIKSNMKMIAQSGYSAVQTSPVQQSKSQATTGAWTSEWSKLYQPVAFSVAADSYLGTKEELAQMCAEAKKYGVKVICDIVVNHMGNNEKGEAGSYSDRIAAYEPEVAANTAEYFHKYTNQASDDSALTVTQYELSCLPDLNTGSEYIQGRVTSLLKECIDLGVSGFRFDAAKHIETPDDGTYASNFWPNILNAATEYATTTYEREMYYYGEILNTCGGGRSYDSYTKYMSITDSKYSSSLLSSTRATAKESYLWNLTYNFSKTGTEAVVWAESHDTFADSSTSGKAQENMDRVYAVEASHGGAATLYFARPNATTAMGDMGTKAWKSTQIAAVNNFHNKFLGEKECASVQNGYYLNERADHGAILVSLGSLRGEESVSLEVKNLVDGTYYDQTTGNVFTVSKGILSGTVSETGIVVLTTDTPQIAPTITIDKEAGYFYDSMVVELSVKNANSVTYTVNGAEVKENLNGAEFSTKITVSSETDLATLSVVAENGISTEESYSYQKIARKDGYVAMAGLKQAGSVSYYAWCWMTGGTGQWVEVVVEGDVAYIPTASFYKNYLLASFSKDMTLDKLKSLGNDAWSQKAGQTEDIVIDVDVISISSI